MGLNAIAAKRTQELPRSKISDSEWPRFLKAIIKGLGKGLLSFRDEDGEIRLAPRGLMTLKVTARREDDHHRLDIRLSWHAKPGAKRNKTLKVLDE